MTNLPLICFHLIGAISKWNRPMTRRGQLNGTGTGQTEGRCLSNQLEV